MCLYDKSSDLQGVAKKKVAICQTNDMFNFMFNFVILHDYTKKISVRIQYFVGIPFTFMTAWHRLGMLSIRLCK